MTRDVRNFGKHSRCIRKRNRKRLRELAKRCMVETGREFIVRRLEDEKRTTG